MENATLPSNANLESSKCVDTIKLNPDGSVQCFKKPLVARGFSQVEDQD